MNTTLDSRASLTMAQQTLQTVLLIILSLVGTCLGFYTVPWRVSADPCLLAAVASVALFILLWLTRWGGLRAVNFERNLLAAFLIGMPLVYVMRYLFASRGHAADFWLWIEVLGLSIFAALAVLGVKRSPWFLAVGIVFHGLTWDSWHYRHSSYMPDWYAFACFAVDLTLGAYVAARVPIYQRASRI